MNVKESEEERAREGVGVCVCVCVCVCWRPQQPALSVCVHMHEFCSFRTLFR